MLLLSSHENIQHHFPWSSVCQCEYLQQGPGPLNGTAETPFGTFTTRQLTVDQLMLYSECVMTGSMDVGLPPVSTPRQGKRSSLQVPPTPQRTGQLGFVPACGTVMGRACYRGDQPDQGI